MSFETNRETYEFQFIVGRSYRRVDGKVVKILRESMDNGLHYRCVQGDDGEENFDRAPPGTYKSRAEAKRESGYRYDRFGDVGRCTGSERGPRDLVPGAVDIQVGDKLFVVAKQYRAGREPSTSWEVVTKVGSKYFYTGDGHMATKYDKVTLLESNDSSYKDQAYFTEQEWRDEMEASKLSLQIQFHMRQYSFKINDLGKLRELAKLLGLETK